MNLREIFRPSSVMVLACLALSSCSQEKSADFEYVPYKSGSGMWGMLSTDGKVLFEHEFESGPTAVRDGRFFVSNSNLEWEMYTASEHPQKVGSEYRYATAFRNGRALVAEVDKPITIIDVDGNVVKKLDKIEGKEVAEVEPFSSGGYAVFKTVDSLYGIIDGDGDCVLKPVYVELQPVGEGVFMAYDKKTAEALSKGKLDLAIPLVSESGKVLSEFSLKTLSKYKHVGDVLDGKIPVAVRGDGGIAWGIVDLDGNEIVKPSVKIERIGQIKGDLFTFERDRKWGIMNMEGETLVRAKYNDIELDVDNMIWVQFGNGYADEAWKLIDMYDNQIGEDSYEDVWLFSELDGKHAIVQMSDKEFVFLDKNGKPLDVKLPDDMVEIDLSFGEGDPTVYHGSYIDEEYYD